MSRKSETHAHMEPHVFLSLDKIKSVYPSVKNRDEEKVKKKRKKQSDWPKGWNVKKVMPR